MKIESTSEYILRGKTGWGVVDDHDIGWYVGYLEEKAQIYFFALNINATPDTDMEQFASMRLTALKEALKIIRKK